MLARLKPRYFNLVFVGQQKEKRIEKYGLVRWEIETIKEVIIADEKFKVLVLKDFPKTFPLPFRDEVFFYSNIPVKIKRFKHILKVSSGVD